MRMCCATGATGWRWRDTGPRSAPFVSRRLLHGPRRAVAWSVAGMERRAEAGAEAWRRGRVSPTGRRSGWTEVHCDTLRRPPGPNQYPGPHANALLHPSRHRGRGRLQELRSRPLPVLRRRGRPRHRLPRSVRGGGSLAQPRDRTKQDRVREDQRRLQPGRLVLCPRRRRLPVRRHPRLARFRVGTVAGPSDSCVLLALAAGCASVPFSAAWRHLPGQRRSAA